MFICIIICWNVRNNNYNNNQGHNSCAILLRAMKFQKVFNIDI